jgi:hypothetical protein
MLAIVKVHTSLGLLALGLATWASLSRNDILTTFGAHASLDLV